MKTKKEMIEVMAMALQEDNDINNDDYTYEEAAEAALDALCRELPEPANDFISWEKLHADNSLFYNTLKSWGKDD